MAVAQPDEPGSLGRVVRRAGRPRPAGPHRRGLGRDRRRARDRHHQRRALRPAGGRIFPYLQRLGTDNAQGELYLTDALGAAADDGHPVRLVDARRRRRRRSASTRRTSWRGSTGSCARARADRALVR